MRSIRLAATALSALAVVSIPHPAYAHGMQISAGFAAVVLGGPYLLFLICALAPYVLGASLHEQGAAKALFWMQAIFTLAIGSVVMTAAGSMETALALFYAPGQLAVLVISIKKAPGSDRTRVPLILIAAAVVPGLLASCLRPFL